MLMYFTLTGGCHPYGDSHADIVSNLSLGKPCILKMVSEEANDLFKVLLFYPPKSRLVVSKVLRYGAMVLVKYHYIII